MKKIPLFFSKGTDSFRGFLLFFQQETDQSLMLWMAIALFNFTAQVILRRELALGAFGELHTALGVVGLMTVPILALHQAFVFYLARDHAPERKEQIDILRAVAPVAVQMFAWVCIVGSFVLLPLLLPHLALPGFSLSFFIVACVALAVAGVANQAICQNTNQLCLWGWLLAFSALVRLVIGASLGWKEPWAESGLAAFLIAGLITLVPALRQGGTNPAQLKIWPALLDREFLLYLGATFSVVLALFLFSSADRIVAMSWFGASNDNNMGYVNWPIIDNYQTAGLLGRALLWGTQPLLLLFFIQRSRLKHTTSASLRFFWIYVGALLLGAVLLTFLRTPLSWLFCGQDYQMTAKYIPTFVLVMVPLGLLQALGTFSLASRRYPECFILGACSAAYAILLYNVGRQPLLMLAYMFGVALFSIMLVLLVGVIRWGRTQP